MEAPLEVDTEVSIPRRGADVAFMGCMMVAVALVVCTPLLARGNTVPWLTPAALFGGLAVLFSGAWWQHASNGFRQARVRVGRSSVALGNHVISRARIRGAHWAPAIGRARGGVRLLGEGGDTLAVIATHDARGAAPILRALGMSASQSTASFTGAPSRWSRTWLAFMGTFLGGIALVAASIPADSHLPKAMGLVLVLFGAFFLLGTDLTVGADGVLVTSRVERRFIPWSEVDWMEPYWRGVVLHTRSGRVHLPMTTRFGMTPREAAEQKALLERASQALEAYRRGRRPEAEARLARGDRTQAEWLRDLLDREGDFRKAPLIDDQLWDVVESAAADATARAGAATVLARGAGPEARTRLRIAAEACTAPKLRVLLDRAAGGASDEEMERAMAEVADAHAEDVPRRPDVAARDAETS